MSNAAGSRPAPTEILLVALAVVGLAGTWAQAFDYLAFGFVPGNVLFWQETVATPASTFITVDVLVLGAAFYAWMFGEGRRLGIGTGWLWLYVVAGLVVAYCVALPLFLAHRQRRLRRHRPGEAGEPKSSDWIAIGLVVAVALAAVAHSLANLP